MFGFLRPVFEPGESGVRTRYRQAYSRCCMAQHLEFGTLTLPFLSYEAVFVYILATEAGLCEGPPADSPTCCRLRASRRLSIDPDRRATKFSAAFGILLGLIKLDDDVRDQRGMLPCMTQWRLEKRRPTIEREFSRIDPCFVERVFAVLNSHQEIEERSRVSLSDFARPTADGFCYLFELAARTHSASAETVKVFREIGTRIGTAIIAFDSAADWHFDQLTGNANPLSAESEIESALDAAYLQLSQAASTCEARFGIDSLTSSVLRSVLDRVSAYEPKRPARWRFARPRLKDLLRRWGASREPGYVYARFECCEIFTCCEAIGEAGTCCEGIGGAAECCGGAEAGGAVCCASESTGCGLEGCACCIDDSCCESKKHRQSRVENVVGETGVSRSNLDPEGVVKIGSRRFRARAESGSISTGSPVFVVTSDRDVLVVRELATATQPDASLDL